jgi:hypothetical protein
MFIPQKSKAIGNLLCADIFLRDSVSDGIGTVRN